MPAIVLRGRAARAFDRRPHFRVERLGALGVDQGHRALGEAFGGEKPLVGMRDDIDDRVADADDIEWWRGTCAGPRFFRTEGRGV